MITELNLTPSQRQKDWVLNVLEISASGGKVIKEAIPDYRYGVKSITVCASVEGKWIKIGNGTDVLFGPFTLKANAPFTFTFESPVYCDIGKSLTLKTEEDFSLFLCIKGITGPPIPSVPFNPSPVSGSVDVATDAVLTWESLYQSVGYKVYFGINSLELVSEQNELEYTPSLTANTKYQWRVDEVLGNDTAQGDVWTFTTGGG